MSTQPEVARAQLPALGERISFRWGARVRTGVVRKQLGIGAATRERRLLVWPGDEPGPLRVPDSEIVA